MPRGRFITFEGGEGAGKTTQARRLAAVLEEEGIRVLTTREPGGSPGAEVLRELLLSGRHDWHAKAETLLHFAARAEHVERVIRPALEVGAWVICDRYSDSTLAYQGYGQGADRAVIATLRGVIGLEPDLTLVLDVDEATALPRLAARGGGPDRYERLGSDFHARVAAGFREIAAANPERCALIPAGGSEAEVTARILARVRALAGPAAAA
ncbi:MAG TPA: dTMP kinase [Acetobacteraceae bacterium]|nr:dTMP kinase [Acetobacteraceae bacterium]